MRRTSFTRIIIQTTFDLAAVADTYRISKHEVTNDQYTEFLNAVDPMGTNPNSVYSNFMGDECTRRNRLQRGSRQRLEVFHEDQHGQ